MFGVTPQGCSMCVHVHGAFPYFYVAVKEEDVCDGQGVKSHMHRFARALNTALQVQHAVRTGDTVDDTAKVVKSRVFDIVLVRGKPFYGYHHEDCLWMKVIMIDPSDVKRASTLLLKIDYNLHGMGWVWFRRAAFRKISDAAYGQKLWRLNSSRKEQTRCDMEADALVVDILNIQGKTMVNINDAPEDVRLVDSLAPIWADERRRQGTCSIDATPVTVERDVREFDTDVIEVWRGKFKEADDRRQEEEGIRMQRGSVQDVDQSPQKDDISSLVDVGIIEHTQREMDNVDEATGWGERQREYGAMRGVPGGDEEDALAMLVQYIPESHSLTLYEDMKGSVDGLNRMWSQDDAPSQKQMGQHIRQALVQDILSAETECRDIIEASQMYERQMNEHNGYRIPQVDGGNDCSDEEGTSGGREPDRPGVSSDRVEAYASREEVKNSILRISQIREIFGETRVESDNATAEKVLPSVGHLHPFLTLRQLGSLWVATYCTPRAAYSNSSDIVKKLKFCGQSVSCQKHCCRCLANIGPTVAMEGKLQSLGAVPQHNMHFALSWDPPSYFTVEKWAKELAQHREGVSLPSAPLLQNGPQHREASPTTAASHTSQSSLMGTPMISSYKQNMNNFDTTPEELYQPQSDGHLPNETDDLIRPASPSMTKLMPSTKSKSPRISTVIRGAKRQHPNVRKEEKRKQSISQISPPSGFYQGRTAESQMGFQYDTSDGKGEGLTIACIEVHAENTSRAAS
eukprot:jgi/Picre1/31749/NNA_007100.t1